MAQLKSTSVTGNLSVTGNTIASQFIKNDGTADQWLRADGSVISKLTLNENVNEDFTKPEGTEHLFNNPIITGLILDLENNIISAQRRSLGDLGISLIYTFKGVKAALTDLYQIAAATVGDVYFITSENENYVCQRTFNLKPSNIEQNFNYYWTSLGGYVDLGGYLSKNGGIMKGSISYIYNKNSTNSLADDFSGPVLKIGSTNRDVDIFRVYSSDQAYSRTGAYGYNLTYNGTGSGETNYLTLYCDNTNSTSQAIGWQVGQSGKIGFGGSPSDSYQVQVHGKMIFNYKGNTSNDVTSGIYYSGANCTQPIITFLDNGSANGVGISINGGGVTLLGSGESSRNLWSTCKDTTGFSADSKYTHISSDGPIMFYSNCNTIANRMVTTYDTNGNWTMPGNIILTGANKNLYFRSENADQFIYFEHSGTETGYDWRLGHLGSGSGDTNYFVIQTTGADQTSYKRAIQIGMSTLQTIFGGNIAIANNAAQFNYNTSDKCIDVVFT